MTPMKVISLIGTRPEIIKMSRVMAELDKHCTHVMVHTGQNYDYELNEIFFEDLGIRKPDRFLNASAPNAAKTIANVIANFDEVLEAEKPQALLVYGDTNSCLGVISAKRRKIPIFHLEAGNRCFDLRVPEEINRKIVDHLSDINFVHSEHARRYLLAEGLPAQQIFWSGSPMPEVIAHFRGKIEKSKVLERLKLQKNGYFVVSAHREENVDVEHKLLCLIQSIDELCKIHNKRAVFSVHPRTAKRMAEAGLELNKNPNVEFIKPLGFTDYVALQMASYCTISDSGTITEEASLLNFPALMLRDAHERPEGMDETSVLLTPIIKSSIVRNVALALATRDQTPPLDYRSLNVSQKVVRTIFSYVDFVKQYTWKNPLEL